MDVKVSIPESYYNMAKEKTTIELEKELNSSNRYAYVLKYLATNGEVVEDIPTLQVGYKRWLLFADLHGEWADETVLSIIDDVIADWKPDEVALVGDAINCSWAGKYKSLDKATAKEEFQMLSMWIDRFGVTILFEGNHEGRLTREDRIIPPKMESFFNIPEYLQLKERNIKWIPYKSTPFNACILPIGKLNVLHGWWYNEYAARKHAEAYGCCAFFHTHRDQIYTGMIGGKKRTGFNIGCCCKDIPYEGDKPPRGHIQGFALVDEHPDGNFDVHSVRLIGDQTVINGKIYRRKP